MPDEKHENLYIEVELPGVDKKDIHLSMHEDSFMIRAPKGDEEYVGSYAVCCPIEYEKARATYKNGLLTINVPYKQPIERGKPIPIE
jgi:HSP20 family molecular chaperone IbpA